MNGNFQTTARIPGTDLIPSVICLGTALLGTGIPESESFELLDAFTDLGGSFVDTAHNYADWQSVERSVSEKTIGRWLRRRKSGGGIVVATKGAHPELGTMRLRVRPEEIRKDIEESLANLGTECIDLYWLHRDDPSRPIAEILEFLDEQVRAGRIRYYGCSNWTAGRMAEARAYAAGHGMHGFAANQPMWSLAQPDPDAMSDKTMILMGSKEYAFHRDNRFAAVPYSSQAGGFFTKMQEDRLPSSDSGLVRLYGGEENRRRYERAVTIARRLSRTVNEVVLGYLLSQPFPVFPIVGCKTISHLRNSMKAADIRLSRSDLAYLEKGEPS